MRLKRSPIHSPEYSDFTGIPFLFFIALYGGVDFFFVPRKKDRTPQ